MNKTKTEARTKTQEIFQLTAPYNNQYQGSDKRLLFVCSVGLLRSPTAAEVAIKQGYNARSCGSSSEALIPLSVNLISWADSIIFVNKANYLQALWTFEGTGWENMLKAKAVTWSIPDDYERNDPVLIVEIEKNMLLVK